jgi:hypothetical protein
MQYRLGWVFLPIQSQALIRDSAGQDALRPRSALHRGVSPPTHPRAAPLQHRRVGLAMLNFTELLCPLAFVRLVLWQYHLFYHPSVFALPDMCRYPHATSLCDIAVVSYQLHWSKCDLRLVCNDTLS